MQQTINIKYLPSHQRVIWWWKDNKMTGVFGLECVEHHLVEKSGIQHYMTFNGVDEVEETWLECSNCDKQFNLDETEL